MRPASNAHVAPTAVLMEDMSQPQLNKFRKCRKKVAVYWKQNSTANYQVLREAMPVSLIRAFPLYLAKQLDADPTRQAVVIIGGSDAACKVALEYMLQNCVNKSYLPQINGPTLIPWVRIHEAAQLLGASILEGTAMRELIILLEKPLIQVDLDMLVQMYPIPARCEEMIVNNLTDAIMGGAHNIHWWSLSLSGKSPILYQAIETKFDEKLKARAEVEAVQAAALQAEQEQKAHEAEKVKKAAVDRKQKTEVDKYEQMMKEKAARGKTWADVASNVRMQTRPTLIQMKKEPTPARTVDKPHDQIETDVPTQGAPKKIQSAWTGRSFASVVGGKKAVNEKLCRKSIRRSRQRARHSSVATADCLMYHDRCGRRDGDGLG